MIVHYIAARSTQIVISTIIILAIKMRKLEIKYPNWKLVMRKFKIGKENLIPKLEVGNEKTQIGNGK
jgi:hypothetical protein